MKIAISGANGFIGQHLIDLCLEKGWKVLALSRKPIAQKGVEWRKFQMGPHVARELLSGFDAFVHLAYARSENHENAERLNIEGTKKLIHACNMAEVKQFVFLSSLSAGKEAAGGYGRQKWSIEQLLDPAKNLILRPGLVLGNGGLMQEMTQFIQSKGIVPLIDGGKQPIQYITIEDLVAVIASGIEKNIVGHYSLAYPEHIEYRAFYEFLFQTLNKKQRFLPLPYTALVNGVSWFEKLGIRFPVSKDSLLGLKDLKVHSLQNSEATFGIKLSTPLENYR